MLDPKAKPQNAKNGKITKKILKEKKLVNALRKNIKLRKEKKTGV